MCPLLSTNPLLNNSQPTLFLFIISGTIRATVMIETLPACFDMEEMLYQLRDYACGMNAGRWDYIFSLIKVLKSRSDCVLPDRKQVWRVENSLLKLSESSTSESELKHLYSGFKHIRFPLRLVFLQSSFVTFTFFKLNINRKL